MPEENAPFALVVDDEALIRMDAADILSEAGFRTHEAEDPGAAITVLEDHHPEIVLLFTDVEMPGGMNGFALARHVVEKWPHISIVVASGHIRPEQGDLPDGAEFIPKPFSAEIVREHVARILPDHQKPEPLKF